MLKTSGRIIAALAAAAVLTACVTEDQAGSTTPHTAMDRAISQCAISVGAGAVLGALIGNNSGNRGGNAGRGAMVGALAGAGVCGVLLAMAHEKDKQQLAAAERAALSSGREESVRYVGDDGAARLITIAAPVAAPDPRTASSGSNSCRLVNGNLTVAGIGSSPAPSQLWCRDYKGDYAPA
jgi:hypothetical protein